MYSSLAKIIREKAPCWPRLAGNGTHDHQLKVLMLNLVGKAGARHITVLNNNYNKSYRLMKPVAVLKFGDAIGGKFKFCDDN
jgi:hypothetical protein